MTADSLDPYRSPPIPEGPYAPTGGTRRPGWLTLLCIACIVLGVLGLLSGIAGTVSTIFAEQLQTLFSPAGSSGLPVEMQEAQEKLRSEILGVQQKFLAASLVASIVRIAVAGLLLGGGIACLSLQEAGRRWLCGACAVAVLFELGYLVLHTLVNIEMMTVVDGFMNNFLQSLPAENGPPRELVRSVMRGSMIAGMAFQYLMAVLKIAFYAWGFFFLRRPAIRALFASSDSRAALA